MKKKSKIASKELMGIVQTIVVTSILLQMLKKHQTNQDCIAHQLYAEWRGWV